MTDQTHQLQADVEFMSAGVGKGSASIGVKFAREDLPLRDAERFFCDSRLQSTLSLAEDGDEEPLIPDAVPRINGVADCHRFSTGLGDITARLSFKRDDVDLSDLGRFAGRRGRVTVQRIGSASDKGESEADDQHEDGDDAETLYSETDATTAEAATANTDPDAWKREPVSVLRRHGVTEAQVHKLRDAEIGTLGKLNERMTKHGHAWHEGLKRFGPGAAEKISTAMQKWFLANPEKCPPVKHEDAQPKNTAGDWRTLAPQDLHGMDPDTVGALKAAGLNSLGEVERWRDDDHQWSEIGVDPGAGENIDRQLEEMRGDVAPAEAA